MLGQSQEKNVGKYEKTSDNKSNSNINKNYTSLDQRKHIHDLLTTHSQTHTKLRQKHKEQNTEEKPYKNYLTLCHIFKRFCAPAHIFNSAFITA